MDKIVMDFFSFQIVTTLRPDHAFLHFVIFGGGALYITYFIYSMLPVSRPLAYFIVSVSSWIFGFCKEATDLDGFNVWELGANTIGILLAGIVFWSCVQRLPWYIRSRNKS